MNRDDIYTNFGAGLKSLGDNRVGGYLVVFGDPDNTDLVGDYFTAKTDFYGLEDGDRAVALWHHNLDPEVKGSIGKGSLRVDDHGVWYEAQIQARKGYEKRVADILQLVTDDAVGLSSGSPGHLVNRTKKADGVYHIDAWQIAEASLTCTPCEPRTKIMSLKALMAADNIPAPGKSLTDQTTEVIDGLKSYIERVKGFAEMKSADGRKVSKERRDSFKQVHDLIEEVIRISDPGPDPAIQAMKIRMMQQRIFGS